MLYAALIEKHLEEKKIIITDEKRDYTYMQLHKKAMRILAYMRCQGILPGDRVLVVSYSDGETVAALLACLAGGMIFVPASSACGKKELEYIRRDCSVSMVLDSEKMQDIWKMKDTEAENSRVKLSESAGAYILYTSGTEGVRKGVYACQRQIMFCCNSILSRLRYKESDRVLCSLPLEFDYGLYQIFLSLLSKARLFLVKTSMIQMIPSWLHRWDITVFPSIPSEVNLLLNMNYLKQKQLPCLRKVTFTGEYLSVELIKKLQTALPMTEVVPMYGITECKRVAIMPEGRMDKIMAGSCGLPLDGVRVYLENEDEAGVGELIVEGPNVMEGYWKGEEGGFGVKRETGNRCYRTGDLMSTDEEGFLYFQGRRNGLIKSRGYRISEIEVERMLQKTKGMIECAAVGIPDMICGEKIGICVYAKSEEVRNCIAETLSQNVIYRNSYRIFWSNKPLPRNNNGKIDKIRLRRMIHEKEECIFGK